MHNCMAVTGKTTESSSGEERMKLFREQGEE